MKIYRIYFLISVVVSFLLIILNLNKDTFFYIQVLIGAFLTPFVYELDYILYAYFLDPDAKVSKFFKEGFKQKKYLQSLNYAHQHNLDFSGTVLRSILMVLAVYGLAFLILFSNAQPIAISMTLTFLLTTLYLQTISVFNNTYKTWYEIIEFTPSENVAKIVLFIEYLVFFIFLTKLL